MKKVISLVLVITMLFSLAAPACATEYVEYKIYGNNKYPVITIYGDGQPLYNTEGEKIFHFSEMFSMLGESVEGGGLEATQNILLSFLMDGIVNDDWDPYYEALEKEFGELFEEARYNEDGENWNGSDIEKEIRELMDVRRHEDTKTINSHKSYHLYDYQFYYDWRMDPMEQADLFNQYIKDVKAATGAEKVSVVAMCLGGTVLLAYISKYGTDDIYGIGFDASVAAGGEIISETISGKFNIDLAAINRMLSDFEAMGSMELDSFITSTLDLAAKVAMVSGIEFEETAIYGKLAQGVTSALALSTFFTWPGYWALVTEEDYDDAVNYVFGEEGSEKRQKYAKLIEKTDSYHNAVGKNIDKLLQTIKDNDIKIGVVSKYGYQLAPVVQSRNLVADQFATVKLSSFGATTSNVFDTLPEEYIEARIKEGKGKYISPDKQIDASTCFFPDSTWFTKGISHSERTAFEFGVLYQVVTADRQLTVDDFDCTQFVCYDNETQTYYPMTEENCHIENWDLSPTFDNPQNRYERIFAVIKSLIEWLTDLIKFVSEKLNEAQVNAPVTDTTV